MAWRTPHRLRLTPDAGEVRFGLSRAECEEIVAEVEARCLPGNATRGARRQFRQKLHVDELMLARACARGQEAAWEEFWQRYQSRLRAAARAITHQSGLAEELADGLLGDLFGMRTREGERVSKLDSYLGLGSLEGWLCTLLAQAHVDHWRRERRLTGLDENDHLRTLVAAPNQFAESNESEAAMPAAMRQQVERALESALQGMDGPARLLLSLYFLDGQTLAQIASLLRVHESTISRRLERTLGQLRKQMRRELGRGGMRPRATDEAMQVNPLWLRVDVRKAMRTATTPGSPHGY